MTDANICDCRWTLTTNDDNATRDAHVRADFHTGAAGRWVDLTNAAGSTRRETFDGARSIAKCDAFFRRQGWK